MATITKVTYIENGYFSVGYSNYNTEIIQDITAIKMQVPTDVALKDILMFLRRMKFEKLTDENFDELKYRNTKVFFVDEMKGMRAYAAAQSISQLSAPSPTFDTKYLTKAFEL